MSAGRAAHTRRSNLQVRAGPLHERERRRTHLAAGLGEPVVQVIGVRVKVVDQQDAESAVLRMQQPWAAHSASRQTCPEPKQLLHHRARGRWIAAWCWSETWPGDGDRRGRSGKVAPPFLFVSSEALYSWNNAIPTIRERERKKEIAPPPLRAFLRGCGVRHIYKHCCGTCDMWELWHISKHWNVCARLSRSSPHTKTRSRPRANKGGGRSSCHTETPRSCPMTS